MPQLANRHCVPCQGGIPILDESRVVEMSQELRDWEIVNNHHLRKTYVFEDFGTARRFVDKVSGLAEEEGHHPQICLLGEARK